jgi:hypothetical protein
MEATQFRRITIYLSMLSFWCAAYAQHPNEYSGITADSLDYLSEINFREIRYNHARSPEYQPRIHTSHYEVSTGMTGKGKEKELLFDVEFLFAR